MKVLHLISHDFEGGAARATYRLHKALRELETDSEMWVQRKFTDDFSVIGPQNKLQKFGNSLRGPLDKLFLKAYPRRTKTLFSPNMIPRSMAQIQKSSPDLVHLHWIN